MAGFQSSALFMRLGAMGLQKRYLRSSRAEVVLLDIGKFPYMGFGASVAWVHAAQLAADVIGAQFRVTNPASWPFGGCSEHVPITRFLDLSVASEAEIRTSSNILEMVPSAESNLIRWGYRDALLSKTCLFGQCPEGYGSLEEYRRALLHSGIRYSEEAIEQSSVRRQFMPQRYVAWHVRRGDKTAGIWKEDEPIDLAYYVNATRAWLAEVEQPPKHLVICTDSEEVIEQVSDLLSRGELPLVLVIDPEEKRWDGYCALQRTGKITDIQSIVEEIFTAQKLIDILRGAELLVGCESSYLFRVASLLRAKTSIVHNLSDNSRFRKYYPL